MGQEATRISLFNDILNFFASCPMFREGEWKKGTEGDGDKTGLGKKERKEEASERVLE